MYKDWVGLEVTQTLGGQVDSDREGGPFGCDWALAGAASDARPFAMAAVAEAGSSSMTRSACDMSSASFPVSSSWWRSPLSCLAGWCSSESEAMAAGRLPEAHIASRWVIPCRLLASFSPFFASFLGVLLFT